MPARPRFRWLALLGLVVGCHHRDVLRFQETPPRDWDLAWLVPLSEDGAVAQAPVRFDAGSAGMELDESAAGYVVFGVVLSELPRAYRQRLDTDAIHLATADEWNQAPTVGAPPIRVAEGGSSIELDVAERHPYFDVVGPRDLESRSVVLPSEGLGVTVRLPAHPNFCGPVRARDRIPALSDGEPPLRNRTIHELHPLPDGTILASMRPLFRRDPPVRSALLRVRPNQSLSEEDFLMLPSSSRSAVENETLRQVFPRPGSISVEPVSVLALRQESWRDPAQDEFVDSGLLHEITLPLAGDWSRLVPREIPAEGPLIGTHPAPARGVAEHPDGTLLVVGGRTIGTFPLGYVAIGSTSTSSAGFEQYELTIEGGPNAEVFDRAAVLPDDPAHPGLAIFAITGQRGQILVVGYDASRRTLTELDRFIPPPDQAVRDGAGYLRMYSVQRAGGPELWAIGHYGSVIRRTARGEWQSLTNLLADGSIVDESAIACRPFGYPAGRLVNDVAHGSNTALITFSRCSGAVLLRFDDEDALRCATGVLRMGEAALRIDDKTDFGAALGAEGRYVVADIGALRLYEVDPEDPNP